MESTALPGAAAGPSLDRVEVQFARIRVLLLPLLNLRINEVKGIHLATSGGGGGGGG